MSCDILKTIDEMLSNATLTDKQRAAIEAQKAKLLATRAVAFGSKLSSATAKEENSNSTKVEVVKGLNYKTPDTSTSINTLRKYGKEADAHYGNPFGTNDYGSKAEIPNQGNDAEVTAKYVAWLKGTNFTDKLQKRREWIVNNIRNGVLDNKTLMYFRESPINHAKALASLINNKSWLNDKTFKVTPKDNVPNAEKIKSQFKARISNKFIGYGKQGSSTEMYASQLSKQGMPINSYEYTADDVVFVSINGTTTKKALADTADKVLLALEAGAKVLTDSEEYLSNSTYNKGEKALAKVLIEKGYMRITLNENKDTAEWVKDEVSSVKKDIENTEISAADIDISNKKDYSEISTVFKQNLDVNSRINNKPNCR